MSTDTVPLTDDQAINPVRRHFRGVPGAAAYLLVSFPIALIGFLALVTGLGVGIGTLIIWIGLPILVGTVMLGRLLATTQRRMMRTLVDHPAPEPSYPTTGGGWLARLLSPLRDPQSWLDIVWCNVQLLVSSLTFSVALTWIVGAAVTVLGPLSVFVLDRVLPPGEYNPALQALGLTDSRWAEAGIQFLAGSVFCITLPWVLRGLSTLQSSVAYAMLCSRTEREDHQREVGRLRSSRSAAQSAETDKLRRLERDIHDGPQQRLVRLNMDLARARRLAATDPEKAELLMAAAMQQTQETLDELRLLSRGIAPPVLVDRGLGEAIMEAASRSLVPVTVRAEVPRLPAHLETAAYFVVTEALVNVNKHSGAEHASVEVLLTGPELTVRVGDDGRGGADLSKGHGLAGLAERLHGVGGTLQVDSPPGGPTVVQAVMSCAS